MLLAAGALLPLAIFAVAAIDLLVEHERETMKRGSTGRVVAAMSAVDAELGGAIGALQTLAASENLQTGDLHEFHTEAKRALAAQPHWRNVGLATPERRQLLDAILPFGANAAFSDDSAFDVALKTGRPAVSDIGGGTAVVQPTVRLRVPVVVGGAIRYVLSAPLDPAMFRDILAAQQLPPNWIAGLVDRNRRLIARIPDVPPGTPVSDDLRAELDRGTSGWFRGRSREGADSFAPYVTSKLSGWTLAYAIPTSAVDAPAWRVLWIAVAGFVFALGCALGLAWLLAKRIAEPIEQLAHFAERMGRGADVELPYAGRVREVRQLHGALRRASEAIREREQLARSEKAALEREQQALRSADSAKDEFIATLSHELRNPLGAMLAAVQLLQVRRSTDTIAVQAQDIIERQAKQLARLIEDLLDVGRIIAGKANLAPETFDLAHAVGQIVDAWSAGGRFRNHRLELNTDAVFVHADRARAEQIVCNLLDNAIKFTAAGNAIRVAVGREDASAMVAVADEGQGIDAADLPRIFELFTQGGRSTTRYSSGLGIGLAIARRLAQMQGGTLEAASAGSGRGSLFVLRLPVVDSIPAAKAGAEANVAVLPPQQKARTLLVIDDNDDVRRAMHALFALAGHNVRDAPDGLSGIALVKQTRPDVVFVDLGLPDIDGYEVARQLRAEPDGERVILIAVSGYGQADDKRRAIEAGFDAHLVKPVTLEALEQTIVAVSELRDAASRSDRVA